MRVSTYPIYFATLTFANGDSVCTTVRTNNGNVGILGSLAQQCKGVLRDHADRSDIVKIDIRLLNPPKK